MQGKRVGLVTNPSGIDNNLKSTVDILHEAPGVKLVALFGPEHGVRGNAHAGDAVGDAVDPLTGIKMYSLFGKTHEPTAEMLKDIDVLVYDIQDVGCRSYTFYATMGVCMQACAKYGTEFMVLDRPNPLGGNKVEGNLVEPGYFSFVSKYAIPYIYGLTPGELATFLNEEGIIAQESKTGHGCSLTVIPMEGWTRDMKFRDTGMPWVAPSPQIPTPESAFFYPVSGILGELYIFNTGIGYTLPFQTFAASWINADSLAMRMNALNLPGMRFRPINYKPFFALSVAVDKSLQEVHGVQTYITSSTSCRSSTRCTPMCSCSSRMPSATTCSTRCAAPRKSVSASSSVTVSRTWPTTGTRTWTSSASAPQNITSTTNGTKGRFSCPQK